MSQSGDPPIRYDVMRMGAITIGVILSIAFLSSMTRMVHAVERPTIPRDYLMEASRWATISSQESNLILALCHVNYAIACANAARGMTSHNTLTEMLGGEDFDDFLRHCEDRQAEVMRQMGKACESIAPDIKFARASGWL